MGAAAGACAKPTGASRNSTARKIIARIIEVFVFISAAPPSSRLRAS